MFEIGTDEKRHVGSSQASRVSRMETTERMRKTLAQEKSLEKGRTTAAELTVNCVMSEVPHSVSRNSRPTYDTQMYLQRRVAKIVHQIKNSSSSHHFYRHVVEIDELLRCDAPLGFTPSMVLSGVPDILCMLSSAVRQGFLLTPTEVRPTTLRALTPVRQSPVVMGRIKRAGAPTNVAAEAVARTVTLERGEKGARRVPAGSKVSTKPLVKNGEATSADILPFLPPLVRRPAPLHPTPSPPPLPTNAVDVAPAPISSETRRRYPVRLQSPEKPQHSRKLKNSAPVPFGGNSVTAPSTASEAQQLTSQNEVEFCNIASSPQLVVLRDIPSALQALLYHCSLPLVCLTLKDHRHHTAAVNALASAMASMLRTTMPMANNAKNNFDEDANSDSSSIKSEDKKEKMGEPVVDHDEILFRIRYAALASLYALMIHIDAQELTCVNQHFALRDRERYDDCGAVGLPNASLGQNMGDDENQQPQIADMQEWEKTILLAESPPVESPTLSSPVFCMTDSNKDSLQKFSRRRNTFCSAPLSVCNGAVAVGVLVPLMERWTVILRDHVPGNALLDSVQQLLRPSTAIQRTGVREKKNDETEGMVNGLTNYGTETSGISLRTLDDLTGFAPGVPMSKPNAEEIYLLLRVCLHLSTYKHHARYLAAPDIGGGVTCTSLPVLLCLTMARCTENDRCFPLCVECMWNLLEVVPEETVQAILRHEAPVDTVKKIPAGRLLSSLSASQSLLYSFLQVLLSGHRLQQRELRNDMVVLLIMMLNSDTAMRQREKVARSSSVSAEVDVSLPSSTITAVNTIAFIVFDMVCGPELRLDEKTAQMTGRSVKSLRRYHTVLSPTMRVENTQFKLLGWWFLECFYKWQNARLVGRRSCMSSRPSTVCATSDGSAETADNDTALVFDVCRYGLIKVLLLYVDTECDDELVLAWTREELFTLQEGAWKVLLGLMELAVPLPLETHMQDTCGFESTIQSNNMENVLGDRRRTSSALIRADILFISFGGIQCAVRYIQKVTASNAEPMTALALRVLAVLSQCSAHRLELLSAIRSDASPLLSFNERAPVLLEVIMQVIRRYLCLENFSSAALATLTVSPRTSTSRGMSKTPMPSHSTSLHNKSSVTLLKSVKSENCDGTPRQEQRQKSLKRALMLPPESTGDKAPGSGNRGTAHVPFTAKVFDVVTHSLLLLHNIVKDDTVAVFSTQTAFMSMGGVSLLLALARYLLSLLFSSSSPFSSLSVMHERKRELLCAVLGCVRVFVLGNEVAQRQFVEEDGVHTLLSFVMFFVKHCQSEGALQSCAECNTDDHMSLSSVLTTLADLLYESAEAREAFLQWGTYEFRTPLDLEDDGCTNATQLLLRLWRGGDEETGRDSTTIAQEKVMVEEDIIERHNVDKLRRERVETPVDAETAEEKVTDSHSGLLLQNSAPILGRQVPPSHTTTKKTQGTSTTFSGLPVLHTNWWGLEGLGLHGRNSVVAELYRRYNELGRGKMVTEDDVSVADTATQWARQRLAASLHRVLGVRAKVYACLAAVGFDRLASVKASPLERVKLLHIAALPSLCEDEVWGAMTEAIDLRSHARTVSAFGNVVDSNKPGDNDDGENQGRVSSAQESVFVPILSDANLLMKELLDVEARAKELRTLTQVSLDMHSAHEDESMQRFLLSRLRRGTDDVNGTNLVQQARSHYTIAATTTGDKGSATGACSFVSSSFGTAKAGKQGFSASCLSVLEKKRKRDAMILDGSRQHQAKDE